MLLSFVKGKPSLCDDYLSIYLFLKKSLRKPHTHTQSSNQTHIARSHWKCLFLSLSPFPLCREVSSLPWGLRHSGILPAPQAQELFCSSALACLAVLSSQVHPGPAFIGHTCTECLEQARQQAGCWEYTCGGHRLGACSWRAEGADARTWMPV